MKKTNLKRTKSAVSLRYKSSDDTAPKVTAKGKGLVAEKIISLALENNIPVQQDPDLVEVLSQMDINQEIPPTVYQVVAELLAFVYQMNKDYPKPG
ncbi:MAG: EscU/YscU/HrcU family type III secretion system export apparatus switch protein [Nitrospinae bacterium]|nr:EscU/YscU/HrcU family type III secretion system export apparatus switch protein [Nitrospinota bacterium]